MKNYLLIDGLICIFFISSIILDIGTTDKYKKVVCILKNLGILLLLGRVFHNHILPMPL